MYERTWERLGAAGYAQYEVSNFARRGHACVHNSTHGGWASGSASGRRPPRSTRVARREHRGPRQVGRLVGRGERMTEDRTALSAALLAEDALVFGLRMNEGVDLSRLRVPRPGAPGAGWTPSWTGSPARAWRCARAHRVRLGDRGRLLADAIGSEILVAFDPAAAAQPAAPARPRPACRRRARRTRPGGSGQRPGPSSPGPADPLLRERGRMDRVVQEPGPVVVPEVVVGVVRGNADPGVFGGAGHGA